MRQAIRFYLSEAQVARSWMVVLVSVVIIQTLVSALIPVLFAVVADKLTEGKWSFSDFIPVLIAVIVASVIMRTCWSLEAYAAERASIKVQKNIARKVFDRLTSKSLGFHLNKLSGKLVADAAKVDRNFEPLLFFAVTDIFGTGLYIVIILIVLGIQIPLSIPFLVLGALIYVLLGIRIRKTEVEPARETSRADSLVSAHLADTLVNIETVIASGKKDQELDFYNKKVKGWEKDSRYLLKKRTRNMIFLQNAPLIVVAPLLFVGVFLVTNDHLSIGSLLLLLFYGQSVINYASSTERGFSEAFDSLSESTAMIEILSDPTEIQEKSKPITVSDGSVAIKNITFSYQDDSPLFTNLSLSIGPGEKVGLVGPSGAGKSTVVKMILKMISPQSGQVLIDSQDISDFSGDSLRQQISYVAQDPLLFHRTIRENITYGSQALPKQSGAVRIDNIDQKMITAANSAHASDFIEKLPDGYDSVVGDRGVMLSGGERQRIVLARSFFRNAPILLLDEPTSSLDSYSEELIQQSTEELFSDKTVLVIAHRLSTISHLDRIVVLDKGNVVEEGSHKELIRTNGLYADLWRRQSEGFLPE